MASCKHPEGQLVQTFTLKSCPCDRLTHLGLRTRQVTGTESPDLSLVQGQTGPPGSKPVAGWEARAPSLCFASWKHTAGASLPPLALSTQKINWLKLDFSVYPGKDRALLPQDSRKSSVKYITLPLDFYKNLFLPLFEIGNFRKKERETHI